MSSFDLLRERFFLNLGHVILSFCLLKKLWTVIIIFHVGNSTTKERILANCTPLHRVSKYISGRDVNFSWVLFIFEVFLDFNKVIHVLESGLHRVLNSALRLKRLLISILDLTSTVFFALQHVASLLVLISNGDIARLLEQCAVNGCSLFDWPGPDVGWVTQDFLRVITLGVHSGYCRKIEILAFV